eukprot:2216698-Rhodomonas_salina.3
MYVMHRVVRANWGAGVQGEEASGGAGVRHVRQCLRVTCLEGHVPRGSRATATAGHARERLRVTRQCT